MLSFCFEPFYQAFQSRTALHLGSLGTRLFRYKAFCVEGAVAKIFQCLGHRTKFVAARHGGNFGLEITIGEPADGGRERADRCNDTLSDQPQRQDRADNADQEGRADEDKMTKSR